MRTFVRIRKIVAKIPKGRVASYGMVAKMAGLKDNRIVGWALRGNQDPNIPCHRVVRSDGSLAPGFSLGGWQEQKKRLAADGVSFIEQNRIDLQKHLWKI